MLIFFHNSFVNGLSFYCEHTFLDEDDEEYADELMNGDTEFRKCECKGRELVKHVDINHEVQVLI